MAGRVTYVMVDKSGEISRVQFYLPTLTGANYDDVTGNGVGNNVGDLRLAIGAASLCNFVNTVVGATSYPETSPTNPTDPFAQRESGLRVFYSAGGRRYNVTIPGPDLALFSQTGTDVIDIGSNVAAIALKTAIEANIADYLGGPCVVTGMRSVGRAS